MGCAGGPGGPRARDHGGTPVRGGTAKTGPWNTMRNQQKETAPGGVVAEWEWFPRRLVRTVQQKG